MVKVIGFKNGHRSEAYVPAEEVRAYMDLNTAWGWECSSEREIPNFVPDWPGPAETGNQHEFLADEDPVFDAEMARAEAKSERA